MIEIAGFIQSHSKWFTIPALLLALFGTILIGWDYLQWSNTKNSKFNQDNGVLVAVTEKIGKQKIGSLFLGISIMLLLLVEICKK